MTLKIFDRELEELVPYGILAWMWVDYFWFQGDVASYTEITYSISWYIIWGTLAIFLLIRYEVKHLREQVLAELRPGQASPPRTST